MEMTSTLTLISGSIPTAHTAARRPVIGSHGHGVSMIGRSRTPPWELVLGVKHVSNRVFRRHFGKGERPPSIPWRHVCGSLAVLGNGVAKG